MFDGQVSSLYWLFQGFVFLTRRNLSAIRVYLTIVSFQDGRTPKPPLMYKEIIMSPQKQKKNEITSLRDLQVLMPRLLKETAGNDRLLLAAAANPILVLTQLGYQVSPEAAREIEIRARFGAEQGAAYEELEAKLHKIAGEAFDPTAPDAAARVLENALAPSDTVGSKKKEASLNKTARRQILEAARQRPSGPLGYTPQQDPLEPFAELHPAIPLLIRWRQMEQRSPRFAAPEIARRILEGEITLPITHIEFSLQDRQRRKAARS